MATMTIDMTPTWEEILPTLLTIVRDSSPEGQRKGVEELTRMAKLADLHVEAAKADRPKYIVADVTGWQNKGLGHPFHPFVPLHLGAGVEVPGETFTHDGRGYTTIRVYEVGHHRNQLGVPVVAAVRMPR